MCTHEMIERENSVVIFCLTIFVQSPDGKLVASGAIDGIINLFDLQSGRLLHTLEGRLVMVEFLTRRRKASQPQSQTPPQLSPLSLGLGNKAKYKATVCILQQNMLHIVQYMWQKAGEETGNEAKPGYIYCRRQ